MRRINLDVKAIKQAYDSGVSQDRIGKCLGVSQTTISAVVRGTRSLMPVRINANLTGKRFGRLLALEELSERGRCWTVRWRCRCECGHMRVVLAGNLTSGKTQSCGCLRNERVRAACITHGESPQSGWTREYAAWNRMKQRCCNPKSKKYSYWGGRGITVCDEWLHDYPRFLQDMGRRPAGHSLDRIDNNGPYATWNCRWATAWQQRHNRRDSR